MSKNDAIGSKILHELPADGRLSNLDLAERIGLSPSACLHRVRDMERRDLIKGYRAVLDHSRLGVGFVPMLPSACHTTPSDPEGFETALA